MEIDVTCSLASLRKFLILSTCKSFIPEEFLEESNVFPERISEKGQMYVEAKDKETLRVFENVRFVRASNVVKVFYSSMSGRTKLEWRSLERDVGRLIGKASGNALVNLFASGVLDEAYLRLKTNGLR
ncbi:MAG: hypothetical protein QW265_02020 [Candidatus Bathyarchaeia archaeon]